MSNLKIFLIIPFTCIVVMSVAQDIQGTQPVEVVDSIIRSDSSVFIVDVRTIYEYNRGHLEGAIHSNYLGFSFKAAFDSIPKDELVIIYCHSGHRSKYALKKLKKMGYEKVVEMDGGIKEWKIHRLGNRE